MAYQETYKQFLIIQPFYTSCCKENLLGSVQLKKRPTVHRRSNTDKDLGLWEVLDELWRYVDVRNGMQLQTDAFIANDTFSEVQYLPILYIYTSLSLHLIYSYSTHTPYSTL